MKASATRDMVRERGGEDKGAGTMLRKKRPSATLRETCDEGGARLSAPLYIRRAVHTDTL